MFPVHTTRSSIRRRSYEVARLRPRPTLRCVSGPLEGVRVVELGVWVAGPAAGGLLADWGADVVKIEPAAGDPGSRLRQDARRRRAVQPAVRDGQPLEAQHRPRSRAARRHGPRASSSSTAPTRSSRTSASTRSSGSASTRQRSASGTRDSSTGSSPDTGPRDPSATGPRTTSARSGRAAASPSS